jgi:hypothetical protein
VEAAHRAARSSSFGARLHAEDGSARFLREIPMAVPSLQRGDVPPEYDRLQVAVSSDTLELQTYQA